MQGSKQGWRGTVHVWDTKTGKGLLTLKDLGMLRSVRLTPEGKLVAADGRDGVHVWDVATGRPLFHMPGQQAHRGTLISSPDARWLAWAGDQFDNGTIHIVDVAKAKQVRRWRTGQEKTEVLAFSPDGKSIAGARRNDVRTWDVATGKQQMAFRGEGWIDSLTFSASGRILAAGDQTGQIQLFEAATGQEIRRLSGPQGAVPCLAFAPDSRTLASGGGDTTILVWDLIGVAKRTVRSQRAADLDRFWSDLCGDAASAYAAIWALARNPEQSVPYLKNKLRPPAPADSKELAALIADLGSPNFAVRDRASRALEKLGEAAEPGLRKALADQASLEVRQRLQRLLDKRGKDVLRQRRAIEALELIATPEVRQLLESLTRTASSPEVTRDAAAASQRLSERRTSRPDARETPRIPRRLVQRIVNDLVVGESSLFGVTGITQSALLPGIKLTARQAETHSILMRARSKTVRHIHAIHNLDHKVIPLRSQPS
jgi:hypothetical protein